LSPALSTRCWHAATIAVADPLSAHRWLAAAATYGEYTYAQRQTFSNIGFMEDDQLFLATTV